MHRTKMPPKAPKVPKRPMIRNPKDRAPPTNRERFLLRGGPLDGRVVTLTGRSPTMIFTLRGQTGRYVPDSYGRAWEPVNG